MIKRMFDFFASFIGLILLLPLFLLVAVLIKLTSRGTVFYRAKRVGKNKKTFKIIKSRTMVRDADKIGAPSTTEDDPRITKVGKWIRKSKIDELPQLINVLIGNMSLVGPRPEIVSEVEIYDSEWDVIFTVRPGITDLASIEFRNEGEIIANSGMEDSHEAYRKLIQPKKLELQKKYVESRTFILDLKIIFRTLLVIFK